MKRQERGSKRKSRGEKRAEEFKEKKPKKSMREMLHEITEAERSRLRLVLSLQQFFTGESLSATRGGTPRPRPNLLQAIRRKDPLSQHKANQPLRSRQELTKSLERGTRLMKNYPRQLIFKM